MSKKVFYICDICGKSNLSTWNAIIEEQGDIVIELDEMKISISVDLEIWKKTNEKFVDVMDPVICKQCLATLLSQWAGN